MTAKRDPASEVMDAVSTWSFAFMVACIAGLILITRSLWETIEGLYFPYAWQVMVIPLLVLSALTLTGQYRNTNKIAALVAAFVLMFIPALYLYATGTLDGHGLVFSNFDASLDHMPYAKYLPLLYLAALISPIKTQAKK